MEKQFLMATRLHSYWLLSWLLTIFVFSSSSRAPRVGPVYSWNCTHTPRLYKRSKRDWLDMWVPLRRVGESYGSFVWIRGVYGWRVYSSPGPHRYPWARCFLNFETEKLKKVLEREECAEVGTCWEDQISYPSFINHQSLNYRIFTTN